MSSKNLQEAAREGNLPAISEVIQKSFTEQKVHVEAEMVFGVTLWIKLKSERSQALNAQSALNVVIDTLNAIKPENISSVRVSEISPKNPRTQTWNKYLAFKQNQFIDYTNQNNRIISILCGLAIFGLLLAVFGPKPPTSSNSPASQQVVSSDQAAQSILNDITQKYGFSRFIDTWGMGKQGLFLPEEAWGSLSSSEQKILIDYAQSRKLTAIVVGKQLAPNNISLDRTVWGN